MVTFIYDQRRNDYSYRTINCEWTVSFEIVSAVVLFFSYYAYSSYKLCVKCVILEFGDLGSVSEFRACYPINLLNKLKDRDWFPFHRWSGCSWASPSTQTLMECYTD